MGFLGSILPGLVGGSRATANRATMLEAERIKQEAEQRAFGREQQTSAQDFERRKMLEILLAQLREQSDVAAEDRRQDSPAARVALLQALRGGDSAQAQEARAAELHGERPDPALAAAESAALTAQRQSSAEENRARAEYYRAGGAQGGAETPALKAFRSELLQNLPGATREQLVAAGFSEEISQQLLAMGQYQQSIADESGRISVQSFETMVKERIRSIVELDPENATLPNPFALAASEPEKYEAIRKQAIESLVGELPAGTAPLEYAATLPSGFDYDRPVQ